MPPSLTPPSSGSTSLPHPTLTAHEMRRCDEHTMTTLGVPSRILMERAAGAVVDYLLRRTDLFPRGKVLVLCGGGNNGGDGLAVARFLSDGSRGEVRSVSVLYAGRWNPDGTAPDEVSPDETAMSVECARQYHLLVEAGIPVLHPDRMESALREAVCVVDAMLGIGLGSPVRGRMLEVMEATVRACLPVLAVDIPTGVHADTGEVLGAALPARATVTMQAIKAGLLLYPGADLAGDIAVADIGIDLSAAGKPFATLADRVLIQNTISPRARRSHKGSYGRVLAVCGSVGMSGAAVLCASGALRSGAGLVEVLTPEENRLVLQVALPEAIVTPYATDALSLGGSDRRHAARAALRQTVREAVGRASVVVAGCGLGTGELSAFVLRSVLESLPGDRRIPLVLDADALNLLARDPSLWELPALRSPGGGVVLTPHPLELSRLYEGMPASDRAVSVILSDTVAAAENFARLRGVTVVLKDAHTVVASPDGKGSVCDRFICPFGNAGMATGGSGDVLAGVIASLLGQVPESVASVGQVAAAGVALHAIAGDTAAASVGELGMLPSDLIRCLPSVLRDLSHTVTRIEDV